MIYPDGIIEEPDGSCILLDGFDLPPGWEGKGRSGEWMVDIAPAAWRQRGDRIEVREIRDEVPDVIAWLKDRSPNAKVHLVPHRTDKPFHTTAGHLLSLIEGHEP